MKKHQVDSTDDNDDDTPVKKPVVKCSAKIFDSGDDDTPVTKPVDKRSAPSIFDSGSDEDDNVPISVASGKKDNAKVAEETDPRNRQANDVTKKKKIIDVKKRKHSAISEDPALSMYIFWFLLRLLFISHIYDPLIYN